jgi:hypothetical protein
MHPIARIATSLLAVLLLLTVSACSDDASDGSPTAPEPPDETATHHLLYDGNGADIGAVPVDTTGYEAGEAAVVAAAGTLARTDHLFVGWNTAVDGGGTAHLPGSSLVMGDADVTLYAAWDLDETEPDGWDPSQGAWSYLGGTAGAASAGEDVDWCRIGLDSAGEPVAAYTLAAPGFGVPAQQAVRWGGGAFIALGGSPDLAQDVRRFFDMICDADDRIWIAATNADDNGVVYRHEDDTWSAPEQLTADNDTFQPALTLDAAGAPVLAYRYRPLDVTSLGVCRWDGVQWSAYPDLQTGLDNNLAMAMIDDEPYVMYADPMQYGHVTRHVSGAGWQDVGASPMHPSNSVNSYAMAVDSQGRPWVIYRQGGDVHVRWFDGADWVAVDTESLTNTVDTSSWPETMDIVLIDDVPVIAFVATSGPLGIRVLALDDGAWVALAGVSTVAGSGSRYPQLAADGEGRLYLGHGDAAAGGAMSIQVYTPGL